MFPHHPIEGRTRNFYFGNNDCYYVSLEIADGDGDSSRDYRLFKDSAEQFIESGQYDILSQNNNDIDLVEAFLGMEVPVEQLDDDSPVML